MTFSADASRLDQDSVAPSSGSQGVAGRGSASDVPSIKRMLAVAGLLGVSWFLAVRAPVDAPYLRPLMLFMALALFAAGIGVLYWRALKARLDTVSRRQRPALVVIFLAAPLVLAHAMHSWTHLPGWSLIFYAWLFICATSIYLATPKVAREVKA